MRAYFTASVVGKKPLLTKYHAILLILKSLGIEPIADHILNVEEADIHLQTKEKRLNFHKQLEDWINSCDFMIAETSFPSISVGYEISMALDRNKPILLLYSTGDPPSLFAYHESQKIICEKYTLLTLESIIAEFLNYIRSTEDARFTFYLTSKQAKHLDTQGKKQHIPKSVYLRRLIDEDLKLLKDS